MKPAWAQLGSEYADSSSVIVADVDCTVESSLCSDYDVKGYPTIKYFTAETAEKDKSDISSQLERLDKMAGGKMTPELKKWLNQRLSILKQLDSA